MKKAILLGILVLGTLFFKAPETHAKTLYDCFKSKGLTWTSKQNRAPLAAEYAIWKYTGSATQNTLFSSRLCPVSSDGEDLLGFSVISGYEKNIRVSMDSTQTFVPVTSIVLKDGTTIITSTFGGLIFLTLEPGTTREELVLCTGVNSTPNFTPCTRGLAFSGTSTASVSANRKTHNAGSKVVASNAHYVYEQFVDVNNKPQDIQGNRTATGTWTFTGFGSSTTGLRLDATDRRITAYNNSTNPFFRYNTSTNRWQFSDNGTDTTNLATSSAAGLSASSTAGIGITNSEIHVIVSTTLGMTFGLDGRLYQSVSSTFLINTTTGTYINTTSLAALLDNLPAASTSTPTANKIPRATVSGTIAVTWIATSTTNTHQFARSTSTGAYWGDFITAQNNTSTLGGNGSRAANVTYQNTSTFPMYIQTIWYAENTNKIEGFVSSTAASGMKVAQFQSYGTQQQDVTLGMFVPAGWFYKFTVTGSGNYVVHNWVELQI